VTYVLIPPLFFFFSFLYLQPSFFWEPKRLSTCLRAPPHVRALPCLWKVNRPLRSLVLALALYNSLFVRLFFSPPRYWYPWKCGSSLWHSIFDTPFSLTALHPRPLYRPFRCYPSTISDLSRDPRLLVRTFLPSPSPQCFYLSLHFIA